MIITAEDLRGKNACQEGIDDFLRVYPDGVANIKWTLQAQLFLIRSEFRKWFGWTVRKGLLPMYSMQGANLAGANLERADLREANLWEANLAAADLREADLREANLAAANLVAANLVGAYLAGAYLVVADLEHANLVGANLERADLAGAVYNENTKWPENFDYKAATNGS